MDERAHFLAAATAVADLVDRLAPDVYDRPGLGVWNVRALVGHLARAMSTVVTYLAEAAPELETLPNAGAYFAANAAAAAGDADFAAALVLRGVEAGAALGDHPAAAFRQGIEHVVVALANEPDDRLVAVRGGSMRLDTYLTTRTFELVVHGLDLARATDETAAIPLDALREALAIAADTAAFDGRGDELLLALTGRTTLPPGFSVVP